MYLSISVLFGPWLIQWPILYSIQAYIVINDRSLADQDGEHVGNTQQDGYGHTHDVWGIIKMWKMAQNLVVFFIEIVKYKESSELNTQ